MLEGYARQHDDALWSTAVQLMEVAPDDPTTLNARQRAELPCRMGGVGLRSAVRTAAAAYWASWADALPVLRLRCPDAATFLLADLRRTGGPLLRCAREAAAAGECLSAEGWTRRPSWQDVMEGAEPEQPEEEGEADEWRHG